MKEFIVSVDWRFIVPKGSSEYTLFSVRLPEWVSPLDAEHYGRQKNKRLYREWRRTPGAYLHPHVSALPAEAGIR